MIVRDEAKEHEVEEHEVEPVENTTMASEARKGFRIGMLCLALSLVPSWFLALKGEISYGTTSLYTLAVLAALTRRPIGIQHYDSAKSPPRPTGNPVLVLPEGIDPRSRGILADLDALVRMTVHVLRVGGAVALAALLPLAALWVALAVALGAAIEGLVVLVAGQGSGAPAPFAAGCLGGLLIGVPVVFAGPLAAFGIVVQGARPSVRETLKRAWHRKRGIATSYTAAWLLLLVLLAMPLHLLILLTAPPLPPLSSPGVPVLIGLSAPFLAWFYARFLFPAHIVVVAEDRQDYVLARRRGDVLMRGRFVQFLAAAVVPMALVISGVQSRMARETLMEVVGARTLDALAGVAFFTGFLASVFLHTALAAAAYGLAIGTRDSGQGAST